MVNKGLNKALFLGGGYVRGGWLISHKQISDSRRAVVSHGFGTEKAF